MHILIIYNRNMCQCTVRGRERRDKTGRGTFIRTEVQLEVYLDKRRMGKDDRRYCNLRWEAMFED